LKAIKHIVFFLPFLLLFSSEEIFGELITSSKELQYRIYYYCYALLQLISLAITIYFFFDLPRILQVYFLFILGVLFYLVFESLHDYGSFFMYGHVFNKVTILFLITGFYLYFKNLELSYYNALNYLILIFLLANILILKPETLSTGGFLSTERPLDDSAALLLILPSLYFLNSYLTYHKSGQLLLFLIPVFFIFLLQYRTVWVTLFVVMIIDLFIASKAINIRSALHGLYLRILGFLILFSFLGLMAITYNPQSDILQYASDRASEVFNPTSEGTGSWRYEMFQAYEPLLQEKWFFGWRFEGFEMPGQFIVHEHLGAMWSDIQNESTGHHFHSQYIDYWFYFGFIGIVMFSIPWILITKRLIGKSRLSMRSLLLCTFVLGLAVFGVAYRWPDFVYGMMGFTLASISQDIPSNT